MRILPAAAETGIWFKRTDIRDHDNMIAARWDNVNASSLCTLLANAAGAEVSTVEHVMAALAGCGIHNALIEIDGPEVPILDGSSARFVGAFLRAGIRTQAAPMRVFRVARTVEVESGEARARLEPGPGFEMGFHIDFADRAIGRQERWMNLENGVFARELSDARTFCRLSDVEAMREAGLAKGGTLDNAVVVDGDRVVTPGGLRHADEPVRHKMLDAIGDLALAGAPIQGRYVGHRAGHALTNKLLRAAFAIPGALVLTDCTPDLSARLPGAGISRADLPLTA